MTGDSMALSDLQRMVVYDTATQLWQQDLLMNTYFHGSTVGANLRAMILGRQPVQPLTNPFDEAITGKLRADTATIRQNARNVKEAAAMMGVAASAVGTIKSTLEEMQVLAKKVLEDDEVDGSNVSNEYNALRDKIKSIVENTRYNGISLLDSRNWGNDQIDDEGKVHIQSFLDGGFSVVFRDLDSVDWNKLDGAELGDDDSPGNLQEQLNLLSGYVGDMAIVEDIYSRRRDGLEYQGAALESQADLLDQAVEARRQTPTLSLEEILLQLLFRNSGTIVDQMG
ncbi:flagellin N-terminal helical domain-containing protein [Desulfonatronum parangueonense]